ncbi:hypothetical protein [Moorena sp. SIO4G3]|uniref:hypothetical protein n=1 Tax=Moorena sp. SIO4G3 TaxID=2607821 RepID=UPI0025CBA902|nr:hypothetical protein [Moorena sp. SIO4G3]
MLDTTTSSIQGQVAQMGSQSADQTIKAGRFSSQERVNHRPLRALAVSGGKLIPF